MAKRTTREAGFERVFAEVYRDTMARVDMLEREKRKSDELEAYVEIFEQELDGRDLQTKERAALVEAFKTKLARAERENRDTLLRMRSRRRRIVLGLTGAIVIAVGLVFIRYRPLTPIDSVRADLDFYIERVEAGNGEYADDFYKTLQRFNLRISEPVEELYRERMYRVLDRGFAEVLERLKSGDLTLLDDARRWAKFFPDSAERKARRELVDDARIKGVGGALQNVIERAGEIISETADKAADWIEERTRE